MELVVLAAGKGRRFGGLKQLAPVGPRGETIMDYTVRAAIDCGFSGVVLVVSDESAAELHAHVAAHWPSSLATEFVYQPPRPGTAQAVLAAKDLVSGPFGVANADDLYAEKALAELISHFEPFRRNATDPVATPASHVLVAYELSQTVLTAGAVTRGLIEVSADGCLDAIIEHTVSMREDGQFDASPLLGHGPGQSLGAITTSGKLLTGRERVSMNLWGFHPRVFGALEEALDQRPVGDVPTEVLLPDVVEQLVLNGTDTVQVVDTAARCIGLTHREDLAIVQEHLAAAPLDSRDSRAARIR